jgi:signal transduction histidine kinase
MSGETALDPAAPDLRPRLRVAAAIALGAAAVFLPLEALFRSPPVVPRLLVPWAVHVALNVVALVASGRPLARDRADRLILALVAGHVANGLLYLVIMPSAASLVAQGLTCVLVAGAVFFGWAPRRALRVGLLAVAGFAAVVLLGPTDLGDGAVALAALAVGAVIATVSARILERLRARLAARQHELAALSERLMSVHEEERRRLSRELHEELGQSLSAVNNYLWLIERQADGDPGRLRAEAAEARRVIGRTLGSMRELSQLLRPSVLDDLGLVPSLDSHLDAFSRHHRIATSFVTEGLPERLPSDIETALYRITQEALTNVARHSRATHVRVALTAEHGGLCLEVADDGIGFPRANGDGLRVGTGLTGIRERARALHGRVTLGGGPGARVRVELPLPR